MRSSAFEGGRRHGERGIRRACKGVLKSRRDATGPNKGSGERCRKIQPRGKGGGGEERGGGFSGRGRGRGKHSGRGGTIE